MKRILPYIIVLILSLIPFSFVVGAPITHNFHGMVGSTLVIASGNKSATTTDGLTYRISGSTNAKFWLDLHNSSELKVISVNLPSENDQVIVASPSEAVGQVRIHYYFPDKPTTDDIEVYASTDGESYGDALETSGFRGCIDANLPSGSHYLKVINNGNTAISIFQMEYRIENCNCFRYVPE